MILLTVAEEVLGKSVLLVSRPLLWKIPWVYFQIFIFPPPHLGIFLVEPSGVPAGKTHLSVETTKDWVPRSFEYSSWCIISLQQFIQMTTEMSLPLHSSSNFLSSWADLGSDYLSVSVYFWVANLLCDLNSLMNLRKIVDFQLTPSSLYVRGEIKGVMVPG